MPVRGIGGYLPNYYTDIPPNERKPPVETVQSERPVEDANTVTLSVFAKGVSSRCHGVGDKTYIELFKTRIKANDCFEDAMRRVYVAVLTSPEFLFHRRIRRKHRPSRWLLGCRIGFGTVRRTMNCLASRRDGIYKIERYSKYKLIDCWLMHVAIGSLKTLRISGLSLAASTKQRRIHSFTGVSIFVA